MRRASFVCGARISALVLGWALSATPAHAQLELPAILSDGMVLQRESEVPIWGRALPGAAVRVEASWMDEPAETRAAMDGCWRVDLVTPAAGGPHELAITATWETERPQRVELSDIWLGEVWVASGQSNMEWPLARTEGAQEVIAGADLPRLRFFDLKGDPALVPQEDCIGSWRVSRAWRVGNVTAVGFHFGRELLEELDVPVGVIDVTWGGTPARAWTSRPALEARGGFETELGRIQHAIDTPAASRSLAQIQEGWWRRLRVREEGLREGWMAPDLDDSEWAEATLPGTWSELGLGERDGCLWYRRVVDVPEAWQGRRLVLELGPIDDMDLVWFNGELVGESSGAGMWQVPRQYVIPGTLLRTGANLITVWAVDTGGVGRVGAEDVPMHLRLATDPDEHVDVAGTWRYRPGATFETIGAWPRDHWFHQNYATALFNGMLSPLMPFGIRGVIWYQGEADVGHADTYETLFPDMILDWRRHWGRGAFPFYFVQIAPFAYEGPAEAAALLREAQTRALALEETGMAVTMDIGDPADIHPQKKRQVGERLARLALARTYGRDDLACQGPTFRAMTIEQDQVRLEFDHAEGLTSGEHEPAYFTVAGEDREFHAATTAWVEGESVVVSSREVPHPVAVRFGWGAADVTNLWNGAGLPAGSFRTDSWE